MSGARRRGRSVDDSGEDRAAKREKTGADAATTTAKTTPSLKFTLKKSSSIVDGAELWVRNLGDEDYAIRGFGSFSLHYRAPRIGRNPKTGESVGLAGKHVPHFKPGKELRDRVNASLHAGEAQQGSGSAPADAAQDKL